jgi:hypothetical protein
MSTHTVKLGGEWRHNRDMLLQTQDAGGPRGRLAFNSSGTSTPTDQSTALGVANAFASFLLDWPSTVQRDLKVIDEPGTQHMGRSSTARQVAGESNVTVDMGSAGSTTRRSGLEGKGRSRNYDPSTNTIRVAGYGNQDNA